MESDEAKSEMIRMADLLKRTFEGEKFAPIFLFLCDKEGKNINDGACIVDEEAMLTTHDVARMMCRMFMAYCIAKGIKADKAIPDFISAVEIEFKIKEPH